MRVKDWTKSISICFEKSRWPIVLRGTFLSRTKVGKFEVKISEARRSFGFYFSPTRYLSYKREAIIYDKPLFRQTSDIEISTIESVIFTVAAALMYHLHAWYSRTRPFCFVFPNVHPKRKTKICVVLSKHVFDLASQNTSRTADFPACPPSERSYHPTVFAVLMDVRLPPISLEYLSRGSET